MKLAKMGQFVIEHEASFGGGRLGNFKFKTSEDSVTYPTPLFFIHTLSGSVPHITREVFDIIFPPKSKRLPPPIQISIDSTFPFCGVLESSKKDIATFVGLGDCPTFLTVHNPSIELKPGFNYSKGISIWPRFGRRTLDNKKFAKVVSDFKPSLFQTLSDYDVSSSSSNKRFKKSTERTLKSLEEFINSNESNSNSALLFATLEAAWFTVNETEANRILGEILENSIHITGFVLCGLSLPLAAVEINKKTKNGREKTSAVVETVCPEIDRVELLKQIVPKLPKDKPIYVPGPFKPEEIIDMVLMGVDMFDSSIITRMADEGEVFLFDLDDFIPREVSVPNNEGLAGADTQKRNIQTTSALLKLKEKQYFDDFSPISSCCDCYTCRRHTKAYVNHLYTVNELLGPVLVMTHNLVTFSRFFEAIRQCLQKDSERDLKCTLSKLKKSVKIEVPDEVYSDTKAPVENLHVLETVP